MKLFYLTGYNGSIKKGLGQKLSDEFELTAIETSDEFLSDSFEEQINLIRTLLQSFYMSGGRKIIANSLGAYYLLHSLIDFSIDQFDILLLSPVLSELNLEHLKNFPPNSSRLKEAVLKRKIKYNHLRITGGSDDEIIDFRMLDKMKRSLIPIEINIHPDQGHQLDHNIVNNEVTNLFK
ncbi:hypothetical protein OO013_07005 [Mangrovivirga sp. M17]|uniref:Alpha/beta hydrolase n=1 Tax=Mangrovivirga halotolerans TaxID=2993936 RepID=A0ABT3RP87_9BACT|nr:hypothetical protein [Mangrovivirga halotolerans]MCX2743606.1 hypothetical protein [Mangrovivirga halotolerans]